MNTMSHRSAGNCMIGCVCLLSILSGCSGFREHAIYMADDATGKGHWHVTRVEQYPDPIRLQATVVSRLSCRGQLQGEIAPQASEYYGCVIDASQAYTSPGWVTSLIQPAMIAAGIFSAGYEIGHRPPAQTFQSTANINNPSITSNPVS